MSITIFCLLVTAGTYVASRALARRFPSPLTSPVLFSTTLTIAILVTARVSYTDYGPAREILTFLLGPATVALALPLYKKRALLLAHLLPALAGLVAGVLSTMLVAVALGRVLGLSALLVRSLSIKSVTAPVAVKLAPLVDADPVLVAAFVVTTGMIGVLIGPALLTLFGVRAEVARGLALGTISHGQGTARAALEGELCGAIAGIAMGLAAILTSLVAPRFIPSLC